jgi:hypothetical protein
MCALSLSLAWWATKACTQKEPGPSQGCARFTQRPSLETGHQPRVEIATAVSELASEYASQVEDPR